MTILVPPLLHGAMAPASLTFATLVLPPVLLWAAVSDLLYRRIDNRLVVALLVLWVFHVAWMAFGYGRMPSWPEMARGAAAAGIVLVVGYGLFAMRWAGAGDVKLIAVLCLWLGHEVATFLLVTSLAGGLLALAMPLLRRLERAAARLGGPMPRRTHAMPGIPYGFAVAAGAAFVLFRQ